MADSPAGSKNRIALIASGAIALACVGLVATGAFVWERTGTVKRERGALQQLAPEAPLYISLAPITDETNANPEANRLAEQLVRSKLTEMGATFAPQGETLEAAQGVIHNRNLQGWQLLVKLKAEEVNGKQGLKLDVMCLTYPDKLLRGSVNVKAGGAEPEKLVQLMVPKAIGDLAQECEWAAH